ncbi:MAG: hypothetical protein AAFO70_08255, partial [Pseudomonadota bacterium]
KLSFWLLFAMLVSGCAATQMQPVPFALAFEANSGLSAKLSSEGQQQLALSERRALDTSGSADVVVWNVASDESGTVTVSQPFQVGTRECRRLTHAIVRSGQNLSVVATACRSGGGSWSYLS